MLMRAPMARARAACRGTIYYSSIMADIYLLVSEHRTHQHGHAEEEEEEDEIRREGNEDEGDDQDDDTSMTLSVASAMSNLALRNNLERFAESENIFNRQMVARSLLDTLRSVAHVEDDVATVLSILLRLSDDIEPSVRAELVEQVPHIAAFCHGHDGKGLDEVLLRYILPLVVKYLADPNNQVRKTSQEALVSLVEQKLLGPEEFKEHVCPTVVQLSNLDSLDHYRTEAVTLMSRTASLLGKDLSQTLFLERFLMLCSDSLFQVRKVCAIHFGDMCSVMGEEITEAFLLSNFVTLCNDGMWGVRKACADVFVAVSCVCSLHVRRQHLARMFGVLLSDQSRWVRMAAFQSLGPFISTFADPATQNLCYDQDGNVCVARQFEDEEVVQNESEAEVNVQAKTKENSDMVPASEMGDSGFVSRETSNACSPAEDDTEEEHRAEILTESKVQFSTGELDVMEGMQRLHVAHCDTFNNFQYWRDPIPDIKLDSDIVELRRGSHEHAKEKRRAFSSAELDSLVDYTESESGSQQMTVMQVHRESSAGRVRLAFSEVQEELSSAMSARDVELGGVLSRYRPFLHMESLCQDEPQDIVPHDLLCQYVKMTDPAHVQSMDSEIVRFCAHSLPAVTLTLGRKHWPLLKTLYECLAADMQWKVRRTLAFSIHELAAILGKDLAASDLVPVFNSFIRDLDEVRVGILRHLARFLSLLPVMERNSYLPKVQEFLEPENDRNWRFRLELAVQLSLLVHLFVWRDVASHLVPVAIRLLQDRVAEVRATATDALSRLISCLMRQEKDGFAEGREFLLSLSMDLVGNFAQHSKWHRRQTFANVCLQLKCYFPEDLFCAHLLPALLELSGDSVANVRLAVAKALYDFLPVTSSMHFSYNEMAEHGSKFSCVETPCHDEDESSEKASMSRALARLRNDRDRDVREAAGVPTVSHSLVISPPAYSSAADREVRVEVEDEDIDYLEPAELPV